MHPAIFVVVAMTDEMQFNCKITINSRFYKAFAFSSQNALIALLT